MFISKLVLHKCTRIPFIKGDTLTIEPSSKLQMVLGTNGSGKSSLLQIGFTVWPSNSSDFEPGGYREVTVYHEGVVYVLLDDYTKRTPTYSFTNMTTGEDLNKGSTGKAQKLLVEQMFGITQELHDLISGKERFTDMSPSRRRYWITKLSSVSYDYAMDFHKNASRELRNRAAVAKHQRERLYSEQGKVLDADDLHRITERFNTLTKELEALWKERVGSTGSTSDDRRMALTSKANMLKQSIQDVMGGRLKLPAYASVLGQRGESLDKLHQDINSRVNALDGECKALSRQYEQIMPRVNEINGSRPVDTETLKTMIREYESSCDDLMKRMSGVYNTDWLLSFGGNQLRDAGNQINKFDQFNSEQVNDFLINLYGELTNQYNQCRSELDEINNLTREADGRVDKINNFLHYAETCKEVECPSCEHRFKPGIDSDRETMGLEQRKRYGELLSQYGERAEEARTNLGLLNDRLQAAEAVNRYISRHPLLTPVWDMLVNRTHPFKTLTSSLRRDLALAAELSGINYRLSEARESLRLAEHSQSDDADYILNLHTQLSEKYHDTTIELGTQRDLAKEMEQYNNGVKARQQRIEVIAGQVKELEVLFGQYVTELISEHQLKEISDRSTEQSSLRKVLQRSSAIDGLIANIEADIVEVELDEKALKYITDILSPNNGLIAEQLTAHMELITTNLNKVISSIWEYPIQVIPCHNARGDLDYKFPLEVHTKRGVSVVDDVSNGSTAQRSIVDQAFRLIAYRLGGLIGHPLYLDELGADFDAAHRTNLVEHLEHIFEDPMYAQIFMISHYMESYAGATVSEYIVLDEKNISINFDYNQHVTIS